MVWLMSLLPDQSPIILQTGRSTGSPFRVGVVLDGQRAARWVESLLSTLRRLPGMDVAVLQASGGERLQGRPGGSLMEWLHSKSREQFDPFSEVVVTAGALVECDVLIWLAARHGVTITPRDFARHGALTVQLGSCDEAIPFWSEVASGQLTSPVTIHWHDSSFQYARAVRQVETATRQGIHFTMNAEEPLIAAIRILGEICIDLQRSAEQVKERFRETPEEPIKTPRQSGPSNVDAARFIVSKSLRSANLRRQARGKQPYWFSAFRKSAGHSIADPGVTDLSGFKEIVMPRGTSEMADPFVWEANGHTHLLFEEIPEGSRRGRLCSVELTEEGVAGEMTIVLERPFHLSYPCVVPWNRDLFLLPEMYDSGRLDLFRFTNFPSKVEFAATVLDFGVVDTTPLLLDGYWYFFTTTAEPFMETMLFVSDRLESGWKLHPASPISGSVRNSRSAGNLIRKNGRLLRPTQDCSVRYGYAITVNEITRLTPTEFEEHKVNWIGPTWAPGLLASHTWNESDRFQVIDGNRNRRKT